MDVAEIIISTVRSLCRRLNLTEEETTGLVREMEAGNMGYLWENMEKMDIQLERRNTAEARQELEEARQENAEARQELEEARQENAEARQELEEARQELREAEQKAAKAEQNLYRLLIASYKKQGMDREMILNLLEKEAGLDHKAAEDLLEMYR